VEGPRFAIASWLGAVVAAAFGLAALRAATDFWDSSVFGFTLLALLVAVLLAVHRAGRRRAYWTGFALFGSTYLIASLIPPIEARLVATRLLALAQPARSSVAGQGISVVDDDDDGRMDLYVSTATLVRKLYVTAGDAKFVDVAGPAVISGFDDDGDVLSLAGWSRGWHRLGARGTTENMARILHSLCALVFATVGGVLSRLLHPPEPTRSAQPVDKAARRGDFPRVAGPTRADPDQGSPASTLPTHL
jgi:hypothetical protein